MSTQIHDLGYRSYEGPRAGVPWAVRSLAVHSMRRALGLKRPGKHKIVPIITIVIAFLPAIVAVGFSAFAGSFTDIDLITYADYFDVTSLALFLFTAAAAPGVLTTDRTSGMLALYLASPLTRATYVLAKALGIFAVMLLVTVAPILFLVLAYTLVGSGPGGVFDFIELFGRALLAGTIAAAAFTGVGMFISSIPKRWGIASVSIVAVMLVPAIVVGVLMENADANARVAVGSPGDMLGTAWQRILGGPSFSDTGIDGISSELAVFAAIAYAAVFLALTWWRYRTIEVDR